MESCLKSAIPKLGSVPDIQIEFSKDIAPKTLWNSKEEIYPEPL